MSAQRWPAIAHRRGGLALECWPDEKPDHLRVLGPAVLGEYISQREAEAVVSEYITRRSNPVPKARLDE